MPRSAWYTIGFAAAICLVCSIGVTWAAVALAEAQDVNKLLDKQRNVLEATGLLAPGEKADRAEIERRFASFRPLVVDLASGAIDTETPAAEVDPKQAVRDPARSVAAPKNLGGVTRVPNKTVVYELLDEAGQTKMLVLPIEGKGLWSTLYGFLAVGPDLDTIKGITFYQHGETPGLGGEVDNPRWKALWPGRKIHDSQGGVKIEVIKGTAGPVEKDPHRVDGLSGATITARGVSYFVQFWLGENGYGKFFETYRAERRAA